MSEPTLHPGIAPAPAFISVEALYKSFDDTMVLKNINFTMKQGDLVSIIGASGCGKSTLLRCMNFLETLDSGTVSIAGVSVHRANLDTPFDSTLAEAARKLRSKVGMVFQSLNLFPHKTILDNITLAPIIVNGMARAAAEEEAMALLKRVGLQDFAKRYPANLSGGQAQRAAIARALAMSPKVMLYDEPTSALDPALVDDVLNIMRDLNKEGMTQIVVTHEMRFAREASDYIIFMENGEIVEISDEDEIFEHPKDIRTRKFLGHFL
jgi:polar amino acid transport system ATP-binding protein